MASTGLVARAYMHYDVRPSDEWTCTVEFPTESEPDSTDAETMALDFANGLTAVLLDNVLIDRVVISTWEQDSEPYDPAALRVIPIGTFGELSALLTEPVDDTLVLFIRKDVGYGRTGKIQLRGSLVLAAINADSGAWVFDSPDLTSWTGYVADFYTRVTDTFPLGLIGASLLSTVYPAVAAGVKQIVTKVYAATPAIRNVTNFSLVGIRERQTVQ